MTAHANSLTRRDMPANDVRVLLNGLERLGYNTLSLPSFAETSTVPCEAVGALIAQAQRERFTPNLALELARVTPLGAYPLLDYLVITSDTVADGVRRLAQYFRLVGNPVVPLIQEERGDVRVVIGGDAAPFGVEYLASLMVLHLRAETGGLFAPSAVTFQHQPDDAAAFARALGCPLHAPASWSGLTIAPDNWQLPLRRRDPVLRQLLESQANEILARLPARTGLAHEVQRALTQGTGGDAMEIGAIARRFAMSPRTLQRRLAAEGVTYQELLDGTRKQAAARYLTASTLAIAEVAYLLGYSEPAAFHRAFKRWYRTTPDTFRSTSAVNEPRPSGSATNSPGSSGVL